MGDPAGIGPEVVVSALARRAVRTSCRAIVVGDARVLARAASVLGKRFRPPVVSAGAAASCTAPVCVLDLANADPEQTPFGQVSALAGRAAADYIEQAVSLARSGAVAGVVTAPINKEALRLAGVRYPGHTEMLAALCGVSQVAMLLVSGEMRVSHVTTHLALREACAAIAQRRVLEVIHLTEAAVQRLGIERPRIAVAGLNPHAGEAGLFGEEEIREIAPAVAEAKTAGLEVFGPLPPDTVFARHRAGEFDAVVAMTHDHGHIAVKTVGFAPARRVRPADGGHGLRTSGVNVTLGLPILRTSVDHGTAFEIAGRGIADDTSLVEAICLAAQMAARP
jgi:4-hydroxythreonine-4-phosphate dehydrogenase